MIVHNEWNFEADKNKKENSFVIPLFVNIKITFWEDLDHTLEQKFEFKYFIYAFQSQFPKKKKADEKLENIFKNIENLRKQAGIKDKNESEKENKQEKNQKENEDKQ
jgi:hypothetical protein